MPEPTLADRYPDIPSEVLAMVYRAVARIDDALQSLRQAREYSRIESVKDRGMIDRAYFVDRRARAHIDFAEVRDARKRLAQFIDVAAENGVDGLAVIREVRHELKSERRANPSGRYYECRRVRREQETARLAKWADTPFSKVGFSARDRRYGYDVRGRLPLSEIADARSMTAREYRWHAARVLKARRDAKAEAERKAAEREAILASLRARGKQTPEREAMAKKIWDARFSTRALFKMSEGRPSPKVVRRYFLDAKRRRLASVDKTAERIAGLAKDQPWFVAAEAEGDVIALLVSDLRAAKKAIGDRTEIDGKPLAIRKAPRTTVAK